MPEAASITKCAAFLGEILEIARGIYTPLVATLASSSSTFRASFALTFLSTFSFALLAFSGSLGSGKGRLPLGGSGGVAEVLGKNAEVASLISLPLDIVSELVALALNVFSDHLHQLFNGPVRIGAVLMFTVVKHELILQRL